MWTDNASDIDLLFYKPYADIIAEDAISMGDEPLTIGVFGSWGAGKSTLLGLIDNSYSEDSNVLCININAWMFEGYEDAKIAIMETLLYELGNRANESLKPGFWRLIKRIDFFKVGTKLASAAAPYVVGAVTGNPLPVMFSLPKDTKGAVRAIQDISATLQNAKEEYLKNETEPDANSASNSIRTFRKEFSELVEKTEYKRIVVLLDDLDRCQPERIIETLEVIKLFLSVNKITFIIAADENVIQYAIKKKYPAIEGFDVELDKEYIEKLIQLPISVPELSEKDIQNYLAILVYQRCLQKDEFQCFVSGIQQKRLLTSEDVIRQEQFNEVLTENGISIDENTDFHQMIEIILSVREIVASTLKGNPRQAKRFLNTFVTKSRLAQIYYPDDIDQKVLAKLLVLHKLNASLFDELNEWNKEYDTENRKYREMREGLDKQKYPQEYKQWYGLSIIKWINCPPVDLEHQRLNKYFYLTREILHSSVDIESGLSERGRALLEQFGRAKPGMIDVTLKQISELSDIEQDGIVKIILTKISQGTVESLKTAKLFVQYSNYRKDIIKTLKKANFKPSAADIPVLANMYNADSKLVSSYLYYLKNQGSIKENIAEKIMNSRKEK